VNHRFLDMQLRLPPEMEPLEARLRQLAKERVVRGQLQITASLRWHAGPEAAAVNRGLLETYLLAYREIAKEHAISAEPDLSTLLRMPGAVLLNDGDLDPARKEALETALADCLSRALADLCEARRAEGEGIVAELQARASRMRRLVEQLESARTDTVPQFQQRLNTKLQELLGDLQGDPQRTLQEAALLADRADISEEVQRLRSHLDRLSELLQQQGELGKAIDFLAQELHREANTVLSKTTPLGAAGLPVTELGLALKGEIEKIREQAQNLE
jgi:uncharacterized protein (TIGR00255 family)